MNLQDALRYPEYAKYYHGDIIADAANIVDEHVFGSDAILTMDEIIGQFPAEDEMIDILDILRDAMDSKKKADILENVKKAIFQLEQKQYQLYQQAEYARSEYKTHVKK